MNKILTISIAAYNVENYIKNTLDSLLVDNIDDLEILVEDDGGTDNTANIVKEYEEKYPNIVKLVHKENGGYGSTINKSIELAQGKYFKQLDGDDWYDSENFRKFLELLRKIDTDAVYTPYKIFYEKLGTYQLNECINENIEGLCNIADIILKINGSLDMYTLCYKTEILRKYNIELLEHCFYTDTQYAMYPLAKMETIYIAHSPLYIYRVGREEQSVGILGRIKHYEDHVKVSKEILEFYNSSDIKEKQKEYLLNYIVSHISGTITNFYMILDASKTNLNKIKDFEKYILKKDKLVYNMVGEKRKIVKILRKTNYNYIIYLLLSKLQRIRFKKKSR